MSDIALARERLLAVADTLRLDDVGMDSLADEIAEVVETLMHRRPSVRKAPAGKRRTHADPRLAVDILATRAFCPTWDLQRIATACNCNIARVSETLNPKPESEP